MYNIQALILQHSASGFVRINNILTDSDFKEKLGSRSDGWDVQKIVMKRFRKSINIGTMGLGFCVMVGFI